MKKMLFTDMDGTLLRRDKSISERNAGAIKRMLQAGHYFVIATSRSASSGLEILEKRGLIQPGCYMTAYNGALIYDCWEERIMAENTIPPEYVKYLFEEAPKYGLHAHTYSKTHVLTLAEDKELEYFERTNGMPPYLLSSNIMEELESEPHKVVIASLDDHEKLKRFQKDHLDWEKDKCSSAFSCRQYLEYAPKDTDKSIGVRFLSSYLGIKPENVYAVGDERNDVSMIKAAGTGIAMKNGASEAKAVADYITEHDNENDAIAEIIEKFII